MNVNAIANANRNANAHSFMNANVITNANGNTDEIIISIICVDVDGPPYCCLVSVKYLSLI